MPEPTRNAGDIGRRVAARREELGLTREQVAERAGTASEYLRYVEERPIASPGTGFLIRLAGALETSVAQLHGSDADLPPGIGQAAYHPELTELDPGECWARLSTHGVGRVSVSTPDGPAIVPVNYTVVDGTVAFSTARGTTPALAAGAEAAFEVDHIDEALSEGWSVLVVGRAEWVTDPAAARHLVGAARSAAWAGGDRELWVRITPERVTGRRIRAR
ncbi:helix-turn-helix domain-containing protein [Streptomyces sp. NBC_00280]|uniref:helix-turn-helix domain-containing protein n=1 Tax=Streptomyces sp. NBC_00280 TaxID=2975699 RepID=UPI00324BAC14